MTAEQLSKMSQDEILALFLGDEPQIKVLAATCPTSITQGTSRTITVARDAAKPGTPPYTYKWFLDGTEKGTYGPTADTSHTFSHTFSEAAGSHTIKGKITDSCATAKTDDESCTINIIAVGEEEADMTPLIIGGTAIIILGAAYIMLRRGK